MAKEMEGICKVRDVLIMSMREAAILFVVVSLCELAGICLFEHELQKTIIHVCLAVMMVAFLADVSVHCTSAVLIYKKGIFPKRGSL